MAPCGKSKEGEKMSYATRNENGDNMGNGFVRCPVDNKQRFAENWDKIFKKPSASVIAHIAGGTDPAASRAILPTSN